MTAVGAVGDRGEAIGVLDKRHIIAREGFNRWLVPPAALAIHLCIGMAYGFSVFWLPLSRALGIDHSVECAGMGIGRALFTTTCDWRIADLGWMYTLFFVLLGISAATWGGWLERAGPRKAGVGLDVLLVRRPADLGDRRHLSPALDAVARLRRDRRHRPWARLHLAGVDADQMVSRTGAAWRRAWRSWASAAAR